MPVHDNATFRYIKAVVHITVPKSSLLWSENSLHIRYFDILIFHSSFFIKRLGESFKKYAFFKVQNFMQGQFPNKYNSLLGI